MPPLTNSSGASPVPHTGFRCLPCETDGQTSKTPTNSEAPAVQVMLG